jgi:membrane protease YdiL (CAAX protease family)
MALPRERARRILWIAIVFEASLLLIALPVGWLLGAPPLARLELTIEGALLGLGATLPLLLFGLLLSQRTWAPLRKIMHELDASLLPLFRHCSTLELALIALAAGIGEEVLFRGAIQGGVTRLATPTVGLLVASMLFGLAHLITRTYAALAALVGIYLGGLFLLFGNLLVPIVVHATYDFVALSYWIHSRPHQPDEHLPHDSSG